MILRLIFVVWLAFTLAQPASARGGDAGRAVGFETRTLADGTELGIWYPARGTPTQQRIGLTNQSVVTGARPDGLHLPLIVLSHGTGGAYSSHVDTALALAAAGFVVAAPTHPGDNWRDQSRASQVEARPQTLSATITYMLTSWRAHDALNPQRVGAFGFSSGGFTVLAAAGGRPDLSLTAPHCAAHPDFFDCRLVAAHPRTAMPWPAIRDTRIKALVVAAPALGFSFGEHGLRNVRVPVQLWRADADQILPAPFYADAVRAALPLTPDFHSVPGAGHFDFLAPCAYAADAPVPCGSAPGFDRAAFHAEFNAAVVRFFECKL